MAERAFAHALRRLRRGWRSGELLILALAMVVAVSAMSAVSLFFSSLNEAIARQTGETLGGDYLLSSRKPIPDDALQRLESAGVRVVRGTVFASVVVHGDATALASVKGVDDGFPLRGRVRIADEPFGAVRDAAGVPARGEAWVDGRLWQQLALAPAAQVQVGARTFTVRAVIAEEPGRGFSFTDLAPRVLLNGADVAATGLLGPGARAEYIALVAGAPAALEKVAALELPPAIKRETPEQAAPEVMGAVGNSYGFLALARLAASLLAAAAIALCAGLWGQRLRDEVAVLKCLGARSGYVLRVQLALLLLLGALTVVAGVAVGYAAQQGLAALLGGVMDLNLPDPPLLWPALRAGGLALALLLGFALPPILQACETSPIRIFQRDPRAPQRRMPMLAATAAVLAMLWLQFRDAQLAGIVLGGIAASALVLGLLAWLLVRALAPLKRAVGTSWRFGLGNVARRGWGSVAQTVALGQALLALLLVTVVQQDLLSSWRDKLPAGTPNQFLVGIQTEQIPALRAFFAERGFAEPQVWPMARGRLTHKNGQPVTAETFADPRAQRWINRDFNLSWTAALNADNTVVEGEWWGEAGRGRPWLSADTSAMERLELKLGDRLTLDFAGTPVEFTLHNVRKVQWDSFRPNFFLLTAPGVLEDAAVAQWLSSFHLPAERRAVLRELIAAFPTVTVLDVDALMTQVRAIMDRIVRAVEFVFVFTLAAGITVLLAAIEASRGERIRESGVLRALGARSGLILRGLVAEYAVLGVLAGTVAAIVAQTVAWLLADRVFNIPYGLRPLFWLAGAGAGAALVAALGWLSLRGTLKTPPHTVLRGST